MFLVPCTYIDHIISFDLLFACVEQIRLDTANSIWHEREPVLQRCCDSKVSYRGVLVVLVLDEAPRAIHVIAS